MREAIRFKFFDDHTCPTTLPIFFAVILLFWSVINPVTTGTSLAEEDKKTNHILYINSYHPGYSWSDDIENGLIESFKLSDRKIELSVEYLDSRRFPEKTLQNKQASIMLTKYAGFRHDLVIVSDNAAFNFAIRNRERLFPGLPIVFCGYNSFRPDVLRGLTNITGVNEEIDIKGLIETALYIQPKTRTLAFILSTGDVSSKLNAEKAEASYEANKTILWIALIVFATLIAFIIILSLNIFRRLRAEKELQKHRDHLEKLVKERTAELTDANRALTDREERFRGLSDAAFEGIVFSENGIIIEVNNRYCEMFGYRPFEVIDKAVTDLVSPAEREKVKSKILSGYEQLYETIALRKDGSTFPCKVQARMMNYQGRSIRVAAFWDITEHKLAEKALQESNARFRNLTEMTSDWIWEIDKDACYTYVSPKISDILGYDPEEIIGKTPFHLMPHEEADRVSKIFNNIAASQEPFDCLENINLHKNGHPVVLESSGTPVFRDDGEFLGYRGIDRDITRRKQIEDGLLRESERLSAVLDGNPISIFMIDQDGRVVFWNRAFEKISMLPREQALGKTLTESLTQLYPKKTPPILADLILKMNDEDLLKLYGHKIRRAGFGESFEATASIWPDGKERVLDIIATRIRDHQGNVLGAIQCAQDVTEKKRLEDQLLQAHKMESIGTLAGGIAHDFNNILAIIIGNAELAMDGVPEWNPARLNLEEIRSASLRAKDVVSQLLSFARKTKLEKKPTNIIPIVKESLKLLRSSIPTSIEIRQNISKDVGTILADSTQIHQILINLFTNANHAMLNEGVIEVTLKNVELGENATARYPDLNPGRYANLTISDDGQGIPKEVIDRIFDPYFSTKEVGKGTGMGLAVVHGIVQGHKGLITVESELGKGTTFSIFFPIVEKMAVLETKANGELPAGDERILLIDDEESIVTLGRSRLEHLGYKVEATTSPIDALEIFRSRPDQFDLVITDLTMPKMRGDKLVKEILNIRSDIPVILCTGFSEKIDELVAKSIGAAEYIEKPFNKRDFAFTVRKVLDQR